MRKQTNMVVDWIVWVLVAGAAVYFGFFNHDPLFVALTVVALLWLAGYWTVRTYMSLHESKLGREQIEIKTREIAFQKERMEAFVELSHDGIIVLDKDQHVLRINDAITSITGYTKAEVLGQPCHVVFRCPKYKEAGLCFGVAYLSEDHPNHYEEVSVITKDGRPIEVGVRCAKAKKHEGHRGATLMLVRDLTTIHEAESLEHDFVSMTSHQLFTPLSIIRGHISMMLDGDVGKITPKQHYFLAQSIEATKRMVHLVSELLSISRLEERKITLNFAPVDLAELIPPLVEEIHALADHKHISLQFTKPTHPLPTISVDGEKIAQVLQNLIDNAIKYTPDHGKITISTELRAHDVLIKVTDTGIGIPAGDVPKLFQRFFRSSNAFNLDTKGTGLGLYIARVIVERHNGTISVTSHEGKGSTFSVSLPR